ncbi:trypsin-like peptidase domain-containing protein [Streptomyces botrytidirepellens]|uniref:PDZ domain-containing protein n=1 Tax=Streptomyces botrytidirepellens TaxID=2486417 RepID=A0A3M8VX01_9ACTN|nr:trypsin-like peptidase domain-containing protein [Streptomyces botrytidirepellens]RNG21667.1 PDZ domain-containing protein [Streptomyces botrytidirepellens]
MDERKAPGPKPKWWSRPVAGPGDRQSDDAAETGAEPSAEMAAETAAERAVPSGPEPERPTGADDRREAADGTRAGAGRPLHDPDPYSTPPYGGPGPWAPAPPVQHPGTTPAHGTQLPPGAVPQPAPQPGTAQPGSAQPGMMTPAHGTQLPPGGHGAPPPSPHTGMTPAEGTPVPAQWQAYDPWTVAPPPTERKVVSRRRAFVAVLLIALIAGCLGGGIGAYVERDRASGGVDVKLPQAPLEKGTRSPGSVAGIASSALPGVVTIHVSGSSEEGTGTGFVLDKQGHILTNNHVVAPAGSEGDISVTFNGGQTARAKLVGRDAGYDLAVIRVEGVSGLSPLPLGNSESVQVGDPVVAIGAPFDLAGTVTSGIISAKERPITAGGEEEDGSDISYVDALQTDAPINPGNSGGPLVDGKARVIGINSAIRAADDGAELGGQGGSIGLGFAIPINQGKRVAEELINTGKATHPVIGVTLNMEYTGDGARVNSKGAAGPPVTPDGPGDKAGIEAGDVITEVDGVRVHSGQELIVKIRSHRPGDRLRLTLKRDGDERTVELTLGSASSDG